jgi:outer membrane biosynthesis protein TonB
VPTFTIGVPVIVAAPPVVTAVASAPAPRGRPAGRIGAATRPAAGKKATAGGVDAVIESHSGDVEACYAPIALKDPRVAGRIVLQWTLGADGRPSAVAVVQDTLSNPAVGACLKGRARAWRFPPPEGGVGVVRAPFDLRFE